MENKKRVRELKGFKPMKGLFANRGTLTPRPVKARPLTEEEKAQNKKEAEAFWKQLGLLFEDESLDDFEINEKYGTRCLDKKKKKL